MDGTEGLVRGAKATDSKLNLERISELFELKLTKLQPALPSLFRGSLSLNSLLSEKAKFLGPSTDT